MKIDKVLTINDTLQPGFWLNNVLDKKISAKLTAVANKFIDGLGLDDVDLGDITFTGSLANYNWTKYSDIDLHLLVDFSKIDDNTELVREYFNAKTGLWNKMHNIMIKNYEVEIYVQDINEEHHSTGVFSLLSNTWTSKPVKKDFEPDEEVIDKKIDNLLGVLKWELKAKTQTANTFDSLFSFE